MEIAVINWVMACPACLTVWRPNLRPLFVPVVCCVSFCAPHAKSLWAGAPCLPPCGQLRAPGSNAALGAKNKHPRKQTTKQGVRNQ